MAIRPEPTPSEQASLRAAGMRRARAATRWLAGGAVVVTGAFTGLLAPAARDAESTTGSSYASASAPPRPADAATDATVGRVGATLQPPARAPRATSATPDAVSGPS